MSNGIWCPDFRILGTGGLALARFGFFAPTLTVLFITPVAPYAVEGYAVQGRGMEPMHRLRNGHLLYYTISKDEKKYSGLPGRQDPYY